MLKFKCDRCGKEMQRGEAWAIVLAPGAYAAEGAKERTQGEICGDCAEVLLKEMIYMEAYAPARQGCRALQGTDEASCEGEVPAQDCHDRCAHRSRNDMKGDTCDRKVPAQDCNDRCENRSRNDIEGDTCDRKVPAQDCNGAARIKMTKKKNAEGRCITVARIRMGITQKELADLMYTEDSTISSYERGEVKKIPWDELYRVMPELEEIRKNGCKAYCEDPTACLGGGKCYYARRW